MLARSNKTNSINRDSRNQWNNVIMRFDFECKKPKYCVEKTKTTQPKYNNIQIKTNLNRIDHEAIHMFFWISYTF